MTEWKFEMGDELKDTISGFKGVVVAREEYITGCRRYGLQPKCKKDKQTELPEAIAFDEVSLIRTKTKKKKLPYTGDGGAPTRGVKW